MGTTPLPYFPQSKMSSLLKFNVVCDTWYCNKVFYKSMNCGTSRTFQAGKVNLYLEYVSIPMKTTGSFLYHGRDLVLFNCHQVAD